jgi:hypothetical protein
MSPGPHAGGGSLGRLARAVVAPLLSGFVGAVVFLVMMQGSFHRGYTDLDFNHVLGTLIEGDAEEVGTTNEALGVIGDTVGPTGLWSTILGGVALMVVHELVIVRVVRRHWLVQAAPLAVLTMLAVGVLYCGLATARFDTPTGIFGTEAGGITPLVIVLSSIGFAIVGARVHDLARSVAWWEERPDPMAERLEEVAGIEPAD